MMVGIQARGWQNLAVDRDPDLEKAMARQDSPQGLKSSSSDQDLLKNRGYLREQGASRKGKETHV